MNRAERRRINREKLKADKTFIFKESELKHHAEEMVMEEIKRQKEVILYDSINKAMLLLFVLPMKVLMDHYWTKSYQKKIPEFTNYLLDYYSRWQDGKLDMEQMKADLWEYGGVRLEEKQ